MNRLLVTLSVLLIACLLNPVCMYAQQENDVWVYGEDVEIPYNAKNVGSIKIGDNMRTNCGYSRTLEQAKEKARKLGANLIKITQVKVPNQFSTCYRIKAKAYYLENTGEISQYRDSLMARLIPPDADYALLYIYRQSSGFASNAGYDVHVNDDEYYLSDNSGYIVKIKKEGELLAWAKTENRKEVKFDIEFGRAYFLNCNVQFGWLVERVDMEQVDILQGYTQFRRVNVMGNTAQ